MVHQAELILYSRASLGLESGPVKIIARAGSSSRAHRFSVCVRQPGAAKLIVCKFLPSSPFHLDEATFHHSYKTSRLAKSSYSCSNERLKSHEISRRIQWRVSRSSQLECGRDQFTSRAIGQKQTNRYKINSKRQARARAREKERDGDRDRKDASGGRE